MQPPTQQELQEAGLLEDDVSPRVKELIRLMQEGDGRWYLSLSTLQRMNRPSPLPSSSSASTMMSSPSTLSTAFSSLGMSSAGSTGAQPYAPSHAERISYYFGISHDPPLLIYRSNWLETPFVPHTGWAPMPRKVVRDVADPLFASNWRALAPEIAKILKERKIPWGALHGVRFGSSSGQHTEMFFSPTVVWIAAAPDSISVEDAHNASLDVLTIIEQKGIKGAVVEWFEATVKRLSGPALLDFAPDDDPTHHVRRFLTAGLGMPIATRGSSDDYAGGTVACFFHEGRDGGSKPSKRLFGLSCCHVLRRNTATDYEFKGTGAPRIPVYLASPNRFQTGLDEISRSIDNCEDIVASRAKALKRLDKKAKVEEALAAAESEDLKRTTDYQAEREGYQADVTEYERRSNALEEFRRQVMIQWSDINTRSLGHLLWAPSISIDTNGPSYTRDFGIFEMDTKRLNNFRGNVIDLGSKYTIDQLLNKFSPHRNSSGAFEPPKNRQMRIVGVVPPEELAAPTGIDFDRDAERCMVVMQDGSVSGLTVGRYSKMETYMSSELGVESWEMAIYNEDSTQDFAAPGDSGALVFDGTGRMVGMIHAGAQTGPTTHVTYAVPAWWILESIKKKYPNADFFRTSL